MSIPRTTAPEILEDFKDERLDYWVTGFGTGGTLKGVARVLKAERPDTKIVVCEPDNSAIMGSGIRQARNDDGSIAESHPSFRAHLMQGWTPDFIPKLAEDAQAAGLLDVFMPIKGNDALECSQDLAQEGGHLRRHFGRRDPGGCAAGGGVRPRGQHDSLHAARHRRALHDDAALLRHRGGHDGRGNRNFQVDPELPIRCARPQRHPSRPRRRRRP